jgi:glycosyl-4,4'-diaponeurosporenoate acyltransferase
VHYLPLAVTLFCDRFFPVPVAQDGYWKNLMERPADKMRIIHLPTFWTVALDIVVWFVIHMGVVMVMVRIPQIWFHPDARLYRQRPWERGGRLYEKVFRIKRWKSLLTDGAKWMKDRGFQKKRLASRDVRYLDQFLLETCRAELTHWTTIFFAPFFFLWNKPVVGWIMIFYVLAENVPLIMAQRYNRVRLEVLCRKLRLRRSAE